MLLSCCGVAKKHAAGLAGLLLCRALRRSGIDAQIYERESQKNARFEGYRLGYVFSFHPAEST